MFDMFGNDAVSPPTADASAPKPSSQTGRNNIHDDHNNTDGYYKSTVSKIVTFPNTDPALHSYCVLGMLIWGVFSTVLKCVSVHSKNRIVILKLIWNNKTMTCVTHKELRILRLL